MTSDKHRILAALSQSDEEFLANLEDGRGLFSQLAATFAGPMRVWTIVGFVWVLSATALGFFAVVKMFQAETTRDLILWAAAGWAGWTMQIAIKQWIFERMNTLTILRELKKIELRLTRLEGE